MAPLAKLGREDISLVKNPANKKKSSSLEYYRSLQINKQTFYFINPTWIFNLGDVKCLVVSVKCFG